MLILKLGIHTITIIGLFLSLFGILGFFRDKKRISLYETIKSDLKVSLDHPGANKFIKYFVLTNPYYKNFDLSEIETITVRALGLGSITNNRNDTQLLAGQVVLKRHNGQTSRNICSIEELRSWSEETLFWKWFAWILLAIGISLETIVFACEEFFSQ